MIRDAAFGQYYPAKSFLHALDSRAKILLSIVYISAVFLSLSYVGFLIVALFLLTAIFFSRVPLLSVLKSVKPILFLVVFIIF